MFDFTVQKAVHDSYIIVVYASMVPRIKVVATQRCINAT